MERKHHNIRTMRLQSRLFMLAGLLFFFSATVKGQYTAVKSNLLYDATTTVNIGIERELSPRWSLDLSGNYNGWNLGDRKWKHWLVQPEIRWWLGDSFERHYFGIHLHGGRLNLGHLPFGGFSLRNYYRQGWFYGAGISYGYQWKLGNRWKMEAGIGLGYARFDYEEYGCSICGGKLGEGADNYWGVTKLNLSLIYVLSLKKRMRH